MSKIVQKMRRKINWEKRTHRQYWGKKSINHPITHFKYLLLIIRHWRRRINLDRAHYLELSRLWSKLILILTYIQVQLLLSQSTRDIDLRSYKHWIISNSNIAPNKNVLFLGDESTGQLDQCMADFTQYFHLQPVKPISSSSTRRDRRLADIKWVHAAKEKHRVKARCLPRAYTHNSQIPGEDTNEK